MSHRASWRRWSTRLALVGWVRAGVLAQAAQIEQRLEVTIKDFTFITKQVPLMPNVPTVMTIRNDDEVRHDFGSTVFQNTLTHVESHGVISYGQGIGGLFLDPSRDASVKFVIERPGRYEFRCSIHPEMRGELLLLHIAGLPVLP